MKRTYEIRAEKVVYYRKEVVLDTDDWDQIDDLLAGICEQEYSSWAEVPVAIQQQVIEEFESTLEDEDVTDDVRVDGASSSSSHPMGVEE